MYSIVIPCYNEEKNIEILLKRFSDVVKRGDIEIILVNNGSTDNSKEIFDKLLPHYPFAKKVVVDVNQGYGYGILQGLKSAKGDFIGWTHADMQTDPADIIKAIDIIENNNSNPKLFVKGTRKGRGIFDNFFTISMSIFESLYLQALLWEINAQPNIFHKSFYQQWQNPPSDFALDLYVYCKAKKMGMKIKRFAVKFPPRIHGISSWNTSFSAKIKFIKRTILFSKKLKQIL